MSTPSLRQQTAHVRRLAHNNPGGTATPHLQCLAVAHGEGVAGTGTCHSRERNSLNERHTAQQKTR